MRFFWTVTVSCLVLGSVVQAFIANGSHPDFPGMCFIQEGFVISPGHPVPLKNQCCEAYCGKDLIYELKCCRLPPVPEGPCYNVESLALPYPDCCPSIVCEDF